MISLFNDMITEKDSITYHMKVSIGQTSLRIPVKENSVHLVSSDYISTLTQFIHVALDSSSQYLKELLPKINSVILPLLLLPSWNCVMESSKATHVLMRCQHCSCYGQLYKCN